MREREGERRKRLTRAEQRERTREDLVDAAERRFTRDGFHATSVDQIAAEAGYTKGAVYSNFSSKEDLFFAVYERRAQRAMDEAHEAIADAGPFEGLNRLSQAAMRRRDADDGWLAVFFEFWAHAIRHPEHRARFAAIHGRAQEPFVAAVERFGEERGATAPVPPDKLTAAVMAMMIGLSLERLTRPALVDPELASELGGLVLEHMHTGGGEKRDADRTTAHVRRRRASRA
ncbi:MAG TPA: TetR/AcrR family transcriptional regulator [Solirubrobacteraceae bacterium]